MFLKLRKEHTGVMNEMNNIEDLLFKVFKALLKSYGKIEGCKLFQELIRRVNFDEGF